MTALWAQEAADRFWAQAGSASRGFPRDLRQAVALALPLAIVDLPRLRVSRMQAWLARRGAALVANTPDRPIRACLVARDGTGIVFLDGADPDDERRFSLAHEVAHFLVEYVLPRERAVDRLGCHVLPVLDGRRAPSQREQAGALLVGVSLRLQLHLMDRTPDGHPCGQHVTAAEQQADALALELLAPVETVRALLPAPTPALAEALLATTFGLPPTIAKFYARQLLPQDEDVPSLLHRWGLL